MAKCKCGIASRLSKRVTIQSFTEGSKDELGGYSARTWVDSSNVWAEIKPSTGREVREDLREDEQVSFKITMRYYGGKLLLDAADRNKWRIKYGTRFFNIRAVINKDEADNIVEVYCDESTVGEDGNAKS